MQPLEVGPYTTKEGELLVELKSDRLIVQTHYQDGRKQAVMLKGTGGSSAVGSNFLCLACLDTEKQR